MITLFAVPKAFRGHIAVIQRNAIMSWLEFRPFCEIILLGDDYGTADIAREYNIRHIASIDRNEFGTPLVDSIFRIAEGAAVHSIMCYVNADIILLKDFLHAVTRVLERKPSCLMIGRRWDLDVNEPIDFSGDWESEIRAALRQRGVLHGHSGMDYYVFPRGLWKTIPPFAIGRSAWDNWLVYQAYKQNVPIIDITDAVTVVHQNHDYSHVGAGRSYDTYHPEFRRNRELAGDYSHMFTVWDAHYELTKNGVLRKRFHVFLIYRTLLSLARSFPILKPLPIAVRGIATMFRTVVRPRKQPYT